MNRFKRTTPGCRSTVAAGLEIRKTKDLGLDAAWLNFVRYSLSLSNLALENTLQKCHQKILRYLKNIQEWCTMIYTCWILWEHPSQPCFSDVSEMLPKKLRGREACLHAVHSQLLWWNVADAAPDCLNSPFGPRPWSRAPWSWWSHFCWAIGKPQIPETTCSRSRGHSCRLFLWRISFGTQHWTIVNWWKPLGRGMD